MPSNAVALFDPEKAARDLEERAQEAAIEQQDRRELGRLRARLLTLLTARPDIEVVVLDASWDGGGKFNLWFESGQAATIELRTGE